MIGTLRKHSKWLWFIIIAATVVSFVYWGSQSSQRGGGGGGRADYGTINGERITPEAYGEAYREGLLRFFINYKEWPGKDAKRMGFDPDREAYFRLLLLQKAKELNIHASSEAVAQVASAVLRSLNRGNPVPVDMFEKQVLRPQGLTTEDLERFIRHDLELQQLITTVGLSGKLITPQELSELYRREHEEISVEAVFFSASNYLAGVSVPPETVAQFYTNQMARYRVPERVQVSYVKFNVTNFLADAEQEIGKITNLTERIEAMYQQRGTNYYHDVKSPEEAKERILKEEQRKLALLDARRKANEFATVLFALEPASLTNLETLAKSNGLDVAVSAPFDREEGPKDLEVGPDFAKEAFARTSEEPFAGPLLGEDGAYVLALRQRLPETTPSLEEIRDRVAADCKLNMAVMQARMAGVRFYSAVTNGIAQGRNFTAVCTEEKVRPVLLPPLSLSTPESPEVEKHVSLVQFKQAAFSTPVGRASNFTPMSGGGFVLFVQSRLPIDEAKMQADLPAFMNAVRQSRQGEAFNLWFRREADRGLRDTPIARAAQANAAGKAAK